MTTQPVPDRLGSALELVRPSHPAHGVVAGLLLGSAVLAIGAAPGLVTALWLALATRSLVLVDIRLRRLPNVLVVPGLVAVLVDGVWSGAASAVFPSEALATTSIIAVATLVLNLVGGLGMGDVKLSVVIAGCLSLVSPFLAIAALMLAFFAGGAYSAVLLLRDRGQRGRRIAFGPVLLLAFWAVVVLRAVGTTWVVSLS